MYQRLGEAELKTGERIEIGVVTAPDPEWKDRILPFLGHKGEPYANHIRRSFDGPLDQLETRYYIGHRDGQVITEVMIVGARGAGILAHVYTLPEQRRKGAYQAVMAAQIADTPRCGIRLLSLGTGFDSAPYWIYHSFGFEGIGPGRGEMLWRASPHAEAELFQAADVTVRDARWDDWGYFGWLGLLPLGADEELPRSRIMRLKSRGIMEGPFVRLLLAREQQPGMSVRVMQSESGATVAWAILAPDPQGLEESWTLDLHVHPSFAHQLPALAAALPWPDAPIAALIAGPPGPKAAALEAAGFARTAALPKWMRVDTGTRRDAGLWIRQP
jgi:hypothetical protein